MLKRLVLVTFLFGAMFVGLQRSAPVSALSCDPCPAYVTTTLNLRSAASMSSSVLAVMPGGSQISWFPASGISASGFARVRYNNTLGYAFADYLILYPAPGTTTASLNLRSGAGLGFSVIRVIPSGASVQVIGGPVNGFYQVEYLQSMGWVFKDYLSFFDSNASFEAGETPRTTANLRLRSGGGTGFSTLAILPVNTTVTILSGPTYANNFSWYCVSTVSSGTGYVAGDFLQ